MVGEVLAEARLEIAQIHGIAYGAGPGSFTGLRIAAGVTQGLALARGIGVVGGGTLLALAEEAGEEAAAHPVICLPHAQNGAGDQAAAPRGGAWWGKGF